MGAVRVGIYTGTRKWVEAAQWPPHRGGFSPSNIVCPNRIEFRTLTLCGIMVFFHRVVIPKSCYEGCKLHATLQRFSQRAESFSWSWLPFLTGERYVAPKKVLRQKSSLSHKRKKVKIHTEGKKTDGIRAYGFYDGNYDGVRQMVWASGGLPPPWSWQNTRWARYDRSVVGRVNSSCTNPWSTRGQWLGWTVLKVAPTSVIISKRSQPGFDGFCCVQRRFGLRLCDWSLSLTAPCVCTQLPPLHSTRTLPHHYLTPFFSFSLFFCRWAWYSNLHVNRRDTK